MSRLGKKPIELSKDVNLEILENSIKVSGKKGNLTVPKLEGISVNKTDSEVSLAIDGDVSLAMLGTTRALLNNAIIGVNTGFSKKLILSGVGYRAEVKNGKLVLTLGFSHPVEYIIPEGIEIKCITQTEVEVSGYDKQLVGQVSAEIRAYRKPEPYKGKGVKYSDEVIIRKEIKKK